MNSKDLIIGAYTNYDWNKIKYWANSINSCGFTGDKVIVVYNSDKVTVEKLWNLGFKVWAFSKDASGNYCWNGNSHIVVQRFYHFWSYLNQVPDNHYRYVITTDVKDVIFQKNPSEWLEKNLNDKQIVASSESLLYQDEPWGDDNLYGSFPMVHSTFRKNPIWNCGVQAGTMQAMKDIWLQIWLTCHAGQRHNPDQAAYNIILNSVAWKNITKYAMSEDAFAAQVGTTVDPTKISEFRPHLLEPEPIWDNGLVKTSNGITHHILHQWDRIPSWKSQIEAKYGR